MIDNIDAIRNALLQPVIQPISTVKLRRVSPGWTLVTDVANGYSDVGDLRSGDARLSADAELTEHLGVFRTPIAGDAAFNDSVVVRVMSPAAFGATVEQNLLYFYSTATLQPGVELDKAIEKLIITGDAVPKIKCRPGIGAYKFGFSCLYVGTNGDLYRTSASPSGVGWSYPVTVIGGQPYKDVIAAAVAPTSDGVYILHTDDLRVLKLDYIKNNDYVFQNVVVEYCEDEDPHFSMVHWFDAEDMIEGDVVIVNRSVAGASTARVILDGIVSERFIIMPFDDGDWTGTYRAASLSKIGDRIFTVSGRRFMEGDDLMSDEVWSLQWTADGVSWADPKHLVIGVDPIPGKAVALGDYVAIVSPTQLVTGLRTVDFGWASDKVEIEAAADQVLQFSIDRNSDGSGARVFAEIAKTGLFTDEQNYKDFMQQIVIIMGEQSVSETARLAVADIITAPETIRYNEQKINIEASGPFSVLRFRPFTDDMIERAIDAHHDFETNPMISINDSVWSLGEEHIYSDLPNVQDEIIALHADRMSGNFMMRLHIQREAQMTTFGVVFWAGVTRNKKLELMAYTDRQGQSVYSDYELAGHFFLRIEFDLDSGGSCFPKLIQRTGQKVGDDWIDSDVELGSFSSVTIPEDSDTFILVRSEQNRLHLHVKVDSGDWQDLGYIDVQIALPARWQCGVYAKRIGAKATETSLDGERTIKLDDVSDFPSSGRLQIGKREYNFSKINDQTLDLTPALLDGLFEGEGVGLADSLLKLYDFLACTSSLRKNLYETIRDITMRAGVNTLDAPVVTTSDAEPIGAVSWSGWAWEFAGVGAIKYDLSATNISFKVHVQLLESDSYIGVKPWYANDDGIELRVTRETGQSRISIYEADGTLVDDIVTAEISSAGYFRFVFSDGFAHVHFNNAYLGSLYYEPMENAYGQLTVTGYKARVALVEINSGYETIHYALWDSKTPAVNIIRKIMQGFPVRIYESDGYYLRMKRRGSEDDLGDLDLDIQVSTTKSRGFRDQPTALVISGGYDWAVAIDRDGLKERGFIKEFVDNPNLLNPDYMRQYGYDELRHASAAQTVYEYSGRLDPAAEISDLFSVDEETYAIQTLQISYSNLDSPILDMNGAATKKPDAIPESILDEDDWSNFYWS